MTPLGIPTPTAIFSDVERPEEFDRPTVMLLLLVLVLLFISLLPIADRCNLEGSDIERPLGTGNVLAAITTLLAFDFIKAQYLKIRSPGKEETVEDVMKAASLQ
jgi:hypothetical protein